MRLNLVAVQAKPVAADYADGAAFYKKMAALMERASRKVDFSQPTLVAFPEGIGLPLAFVPYTYRHIGDAKTIMQVLMRGLPPNLPRFLRAAAKFRTSVMRTVFLETAHRLAITCSLRTHTFQARWHTPPLGMGLLRDLRSPGR